MRELNIKRLLKVRPAVCAKKKKQEQRILDQSWEKFRGHVIPEVTDLQTLETTRRIFYAGAMAVILNLRSLSEEGANDEDAVEAISVMWEEVVEFCALFFSNEES